VKFHVMPRLAMVVGMAGLRMMQAHAAAPPAAVPLGPLPPISAEVREVLQLLHDRKDTLKEFTAKIDYSVEDKTGDVTGKQGTLAFVEDPIKGATFSVLFSYNTRDGKKTMAYHQEIIFDGKDLTTKDFGTDDKGRLFTRSNMLPPGAKPGDAVSLNGALPLPIGIDVDDVVRNFDASLLPSKDADKAVLKLVPRTHGKFNYDSLVVTVDKKKDVQLPLKMVITAPGGDSVTTMVLDDLKINTGAAKMLDAKTPASEGWTERGK